MLGPMAPVKEEDLRGGERTPAAQEAVRVRAVGGGGEWTGGGGEGRVGVGGERGREIARLRSVDLRRSRR